MVGKYLVFFKCYLVLYVINVNVQSKIKCKNLDLFDIFKPLFPLKHNRDSHVSEGTTVSQAHVPFLKDTYPPLLHLLIAIISTVRLMYS